MWAGLGPVPPAPSMHAAFGTSVENLFEELKAKVGNEAPQQQPAPSRNSPSDLGRLAAVPARLHLSLYMTEITAKLSTALADRYKIERHLGEGGMATVEQPLISFLSIASVGRET